PHADDVQHDGADADDEHLDLVHVDQLHDQHHGADAHHLEHLDLVDFDELHDQHDGPHPAPLEHLDLEHAGPAPPPPELEHVVQLDVLQLDVVDLHLAPADDHVEHVDLVY